LRRLLNYREVFKAREKKNAKKFVALKKVLMENEKEGVSFQLEINILLHPICFMTVSYNGPKRTEDPSVVKTRECCAFD
jgi:hypothetical protein